ncbi:hypothetical protein GWI33_018558 [Rhynchophorus ferrugineus]|uniref:Uncharacterized protein n=1 Tax=Rhynchophorus ferrugineus TaxID=354439 RepID=A0A834M7X1_RHYFE|nr:hypothetical protein GWI33_018558 [Rhynchophorus ferrugineus]
MRQADSTPRRPDHHVVVSGTTPAPSESVDTLTTVSQYTVGGDPQNDLHSLEIGPVSVSTELVEVEEHDSGSDREISSWETLKLTARGSRPGAHTPPLRHRSSGARASRNETKKEIQEDDEATLRELLIRYRKAERSVPRFDSRAQLFAKRFAFNFLPNRRHPESLASVESVFSINLV